MKLKEVEMFLSEIDGFDHPKIQLEQYETGSHLGARMLFTMNSFNDIEDKSIADLGIGCGRLGLTCASMGASFVLGIDIDMDALIQCSNNKLKLKKDEEPEFLQNIDLICADVNSSEHFWFQLQKKFDVVIMNPPFGTKNKNIDMIFLKRALELSTDVVYSLHKSSTQSFVLQKAKQFGAKGEVLAKLRYDLPKTYRFHKKSTKDIEVDFFRFEHLN